MSLSIHQVAFDCKDAALQSDFWSQVLGYAREDWDKEYGAMVYSPDNTGIRVIFLTVPEQKNGSPALLVKRMLKGSLIDEMEASPKRAPGGISSPFW